MTICPVLPTRLTMLLCRYYWGNITEGLFSWESAWPVSSTRPGYGGIHAGDVSTDVPVLKQAKSRGKGYMMGLSTLQYKDSYGANVYRGGELNLPKRMEAILFMTEQPDYIQIITWVRFDTWLPRRLRFFAGNIGLLTSADQPCPCRMTSPRHTTLAILGPSRTPTSSR